MKAVLFAFLLAFTTFGFAQHDHGDLTNAKLVHDASHRLGRLVDTGRINEAYVTNLSSLEVTALPHTDHNGPAFEVLATAGAGANKVKLVFNMAGKFLSNTIVSQGDAEASPWTDLPGSELIEAALHSVMDSTSADMHPFVADLAKVSLKQAKREDGSIEAIVLITSSENTKTLQVTLSTAGAILGTTILQ